ncbi:unnamed protein product [Caenorhabditis auriculariae]|uniref:Protein kinase domain-containing protein n=1 Tax=Caenorhabditis auriculariae TaxID=2777116 RepID=A0A8S1H9F1_9PELO|nr:unnamed protein product [Caenorhabditis auriculariae]
MASATRVAVLLLLFWVGETVPEGSSPIIPPNAKLHCPTIGSSAYIFVTVTPEVDLSAFASLLEFYAKLMPLNSTSPIDFVFRFGQNYSTTVTTSCLQDEVAGWINDATHIQIMYNSSLVQSTATTQYDEEDNPLSNVVRTLFDYVYKENQQPSTVAKKKQVVLITDYIQRNVTEVMNDDTNVNTQLLGIYHEINATDFDLAANFPVFSMENENVTRLRGIFQADLNFEFPKVYEARPIADIYIFLTSLNRTTTLEIIDSAIDGDVCSLPSTKMYSNYISVQLAQGDVLWQLTLPWIGLNSRSFLQNCLAHLPETEPVKNCTATKNGLVQNFITITSNAKNLTFAHLYIDNYECVDAKHLMTTIKDTTHVRLVTADSLIKVWDTLTSPLLKLGFLDRTVDNQVVSSDVFYLSNYTTTCRDAIPLVPLIPATLWHRPKYLHLALDDMLIISLCATISVCTFGAILYCRVKRQHQQNLEILSEIMLQPRIFKAPKECAKVARLPWEIKSDNVHIDTEFLLGEGTISNVYLGKLKGKAPIMQWIDRIEMKQFQDCAVAVRVPRHFDEPEEDQLQREIASMRQLRHHGHIALLLGWTNKSDLVCSLLELTHMNLIKYLAQIKETETEESSSSTIPYQMLYKIIYETCDGIAYIHSRNLVHRDLTARNILLTTGLRAKISGFGFCSEPDDPKFAANSLALRYLPVRWLAPECFQGKFSFKSDSWSFGVLLYEMFTLGNQPYEDLLRPEEIIESIRKSRIPAHPKYASKQTYKIMQGCFQMFASRRPTFIQLKDAFHAQTNSYYNPAFEPDDF